jgi:multiple sugar transport system substrate-binding protein
MSKPPTTRPPRAPRREFLRQGTALAAASTLPSFAWSQGDELAPYRNAKVNWRQAEGQEITVAVIPASYFDNLITLQPQFEALTGI